MIIVLEAKIRREREKEREKTRERERERESQEGTMKRVVRHELLNQDRKTRKEVWMLSD